MRLELTPQPLRLDLEADAIPETMQSEAQRIVGGLVVPYGVAATVSGRRVMFGEGSVIANQHVPLVLAHDLNRPIGVMVASAAAGAGFSGVFQVDRTPDGDIAIAQAKSGSRRGLSGGLDVIRGEDLEDGTLMVHEAVLAEVSQVTLAAYREAAITTIAASANPGKGLEVSDLPEPAPAPAPIEAPPEPERAPIIVTAERESPAMRLGAFVQTMIRAHKGDREAAQRIEAALDRGELADSPGVVPIAYVQTIVDSLASPRWLYDAFQKAELPPAGMTIRRPQVATRPTDAAVPTRWLTDDTAATPSGPINITNLDTAVKQWAFGVSCSVALVERSAPSYVEEAFAQMINAYYRDIEALIGAQVDAIAAPATAPPTTLGAAAAHYVLAYKQWPDTLVCGPVAYGKVIDALGTLRYSSGNADLRGNADVAGMRVVVAPTVTPDAVWVTSRELFETRESSPIRLSVSNVTSLSLEIGVTSFAAVTKTLQTILKDANGTGKPGFDVPGAVRIAGFTPAMADLATAPAKSGK